MLAHVAELPVLGDPGVIAENPTKFGILPVQWRGRGKTYTLGAVLLVMYRSVPTRRAFVCSPPPRPTLTPTSNQGRCGAIASAHTGTSMDLHHELHHAAWQMHRDGRSWSEISTELGCSEHTVRVMAERFTLDMEADARVNQLPLFEV